MRAFDFLKIFGAIVFLHLATIYRQDDGVLHLLSKPLIITSLLVYLVSKIRENKLQGLNQLAWALFFSLLGDIALMLEGEMYFKLGMGAFGLGHVFYILWYLKTKPKLGLFQSLGAIAFAILGLWSLLSLVSLPYEFEIPIYIYFVLLSVHLFLAWNAPGKSFNNKLAATGIAVFIFSDWFLAWDKFGEALPITWLNGMIVMLSYSAAQALIIMGVLKNRLNKFDL